MSCIQLLSLKLRVEGVMIMERSPKEVRVKIPKILLKKFREEPRILMKWRPDGLWPLDIGMLKDQEFINDLVNDKDFNKNFEIVVMPRQM